MKKIAFIFAHPDDETMSTGGTIAKYVRDPNHSVSTLCITSTEQRKNEYIKATDILGVKDRRILDYKEISTHFKEILSRVIEFILEFRPDIIVTHQEQDYHIDHREVFTIVKEAIEWAAHVTQYPNAHRVSKLYTAETIVLFPEPDILVDITQYYKIKEEAMKQYTSQLKKGGENFYIKFQEQRTKLRGVLASVEHAEAFKEITLKKNSPFFKERYEEL